MGKLLCALRFEIHGLEEPDSWQRRSQRVDMTYYHFLFLINFIFSIIHSFSHFNIISEQDAPGFFCTQGFLFSLSELVYKECWEQACNNRFFCYKLLSASRGKQRSKQRSQLIIPGPSQGSASNSSPTAKLTCPVSCFTVIFSFGSSKLLIFTPSLGVITKGESQ